MKPLTAQSGLQYHINLNFIIPLTNSQHQWFQVLFEKLLKFTSRINDEGFILQFNINMNEEISKFGGFKDVPGQTEVSKFMPILLSSETFMNSDLVFLSNLVTNYIVKENYHRRKIPVDVIMMDKKIKSTLDQPEIIIKNLVLSKNK